MIMCVCHAESHKENSQPDVQVVEDGGTKPPSRCQTLRTLTTGASLRSDGGKDHEVEATPIRRPSIFGSVALLAESSTSTPSRSVGHSRSSSTVANNVDAVEFVTPPYTPRTRCQTAAVPVTPLATPPLRDDHPASVMTAPCIVTPDDRHRRQQGLPMTYTPPFTPVRPATANPAGRPRSRLSLNCSSPLQDLTRPPSAGSLALVCQVTTYLNFCCFFFLLFPLSLSFFVFLFFQFFSIYATT